MTRERKEKLSTKGVRCMRDAAFQFLANNKKIFIGVIEFAYRKNRKLYISYRRMAEVDNGKIGVMPDKTDIKDGYQEKGLLSFVYSSIKGLDDNDLGRRYVMRDESLVFITSVEKIIQIRKLLGMPEKIPMLDA